jgi:stearoyl-CoA desaturase (delta-9 desaturase)
MIKFIQKPRGMLISYIIIAPLLYLAFGKFGLIGQILEGNAALIITIYALTLVHVTITCMSLSFHRYHTHRGVTLNRTLDLLMQFELWIITSLSRSDWVSVHRYHHAHSDREKDPHSPVQKGFWHVFFLGSWDYNVAKNEAPVQRIKAAMIKNENRFERFVDNNSLFGPVLLTLSLLLLFGVFYGTIIALVGFAVSPLFAIGGVNGLAHWWGYRNHKSGDNSRNIGFLFPLNFLICGELDHNNHHGNQKSCSFRHKWYEFDIGYAYIRIFSFFKLAKIKYAYTPIDLKTDLSRQFKQILKKNEDLLEELSALSERFGHSKEELTQLIASSFHNRKVKLESELKEFRQACLKLIREEYVFSLA